jgi:hypothetical protein
MTIRKWKRIMQQKRETLKWRLRVAEETEWNWPSTRARCEVYRIQKEIDEHDFEMFVQPHDEEPALVS